MGFNSRTLGRVRLSSSGVGRYSISSFQFTHPGKGATQQGRNRNILLRVSIHAPWEGCDLVGLSHTQRYKKVSIHAPWEGCDRTAVARQACEVCFNSRTLGRVRHQSACNAHSPKTFQFTHPGKGATSSLSLGTCHPCRFNSRTLGRVRHYPISGTAPR